MKIAVRNKVVAVLKLILPIIVALVAIGAIIAAGYSDYQHDIEIFNKGICICCGGEYRLVSVYKHTHYYVCDQCGNEIATRSLMRETK